MGAFRDSLAGTVALPCYSDLSAAEIGRRIAMRLREEQEKPLPDNALIATLCDAARLIDELLQDLADYRIDDGRDIEEPQP